MRKKQFSLCRSIVCIKMASLVADYGDSSGETDGEEDTENECVRLEGSQVTEVNSVNEANSVNFFAEQENDSSDDSDTGSGTEPDSSKAEEKQQVENMSKLPNPFLQTKLSSPCLKSSEKKSSSVIPGPTSSVFVNPFEQAEQAKLGILEKHVPLTEAAPKKPATKQVCFKFKKGKCFLGDKCRFFHDRSNIVLGSKSEGAGEGAAAEPEEDSGQGFGRGDRNFRFLGSGGAAGGEADGQFYHPAAQFSQGQPADPRMVDEDNYMAAARGKKRYGVTDSMQPPKRAMMDLGSMRKQERPWTVRK